MKPAIEIENLSFVDPESGRFILNECHLTVPYGQLTVLTGPSGEGKSTLLAAINGTIPHYRAGKLQGILRVGGEPVLGQSMAQIAGRVGSVLQNAQHQIVHERVEDEIAFGCENLRLEPQEIEKRVREACALMQLAPHWPTKTLSGGQKQRLITAATMAMDPAIFLFDEPLAHIDRRGAKILLAALREKCRQGYAVLLIEHRLDLVRPFADRVCILRDGKIMDETVCEAREPKVWPVARASDQPVVLAAENLSFRAGGRHILRDLSFSLQKGRRLLILGDNGSGKTTLLKLLAGLQKPSAGRIFRAEAGRRKPPGYVFQNPDYQLFMPRVDAEIAFQSVSDARTQSLLSDFGMQDIADRHPHALSEGQKRRLGIAALAAGKPEILLLDEPTVGQDRRHLQKFFTYLKNWHAQSNLTLVTVTHDRDCAHELADEVLWLQAGKIIKRGGHEVIEAYFDQPF